MLDAGRVIYVVGARKWHTVYTACVGKWLSCWGEGSLLIWVFVGGRRIANVGQVVGTGGVVCLRVHLG